VGKGSREKWYLEKIDDRQKSKRSSADKGVKGQVSFAEIDPKTTTHPVCLRAG
jgi:hypothetical protein